MSSSYLWDFCLGDFMVEPTAQSTSITGLGNGFGTELVEFGGEYFGFVVDKANNKLWRLDYGADPLNDTPAVNDLGNPGGQFTNPEALSIIYHNNNWYGVVGYQDNGGSLTRLDFGTSLLNTPSGSNLGTFGYIGRIRGVKFLIIDDNLYLLFSHYNTHELVIVDYGSSFDNSINPGSDIYSTGPISDLTYITGFDYELLDNGDHVIYTVSILDESVVLLNYGSTILSPPSQDHFVLPGLTFNYGFEILREGGEYYGVISSDRQDVKVYNLGDLTTPSQPVELNFTANLPTSEAFRMFRFNGNSYLKGYEGGSEINLTFTADCDASISSSTTFEPTGVNYPNTPGEKVVWLEVFDSNGNSFSDVDTLTILNQTAPSISFTSTNQCSTQQNTFTPTPGLTTYSWDFNEDGIEDSNLENPIYQFPASGTYTVHLDVDNGTCGNFTEQDITVYDEPPTPNFSISGNLCANGEITFTNTTLDESYLGPIEYKWDFDGQATASTRDATFTFGSAGMKTITLTSSIPGCQSSAQQIINISNGSTSLFSATSVCEGELMTFTNQSLDADSYLWDFGDGFTSTAEHPAHLYANGGNYMVQLAATDLMGCTTLLDQGVVVSLNPTADFDFDVPCSGEAGVTFFDQSNGNGSDILSWEWTIDGVVSTSEQNPLISFDESGTRLIGLEVLSSNGCTSQYQELIDFLASPQPTFTVDLACQNLTTHFIDSTPEETVVSRLWEIDGQNYTTQEVDHAFTQAGTFDVSLTVTSADFCSNTVSSTLEIPAGSSVDFELSSSCIGDPITISDVSTAGANPVVSRTWFLDGNSFFNGTQAQLPEDISVGLHDISLETTTDVGCVFIATRTIEFFPSPLAEFEASGTFGVPPFQIGFENASIDATSYSWLVDDIEVSTSSELTHLFTVEGSHLVKLIATNANGCEDEAELEILSAIPAINLQIDELMLTPNGSTQAISFMVANNGNLPVEIFDVIVSAGNDLSISERVNEFLDIGAQTSVQLTSSIHSINASNVCVSIASAFEDVTPDDNEQCVSFVPNIIVESPYPNPVIDEAVIKIILPTSADIQLTLSSTTGHSLMSESHEELASGLNTFRIDTSQLEKGIYFVSIKYKGKVVTRKIFKN